MPDASTTATSTSATSPQSLTSAASVLGEMRRRSRWAVEAVSTLALATTAPAWSYAMARSSPDFGVRRRTTQNKKRVPFLISALGKNEGCAAAGGHRVRIALSIVNEPTVGSQRGPERKNKSSFFAAAALAPGIGGTHTWLTPFRNSSTSLAFEYAHTCTLAFTAGSQFQWGNT